jgi:CRP-like cAMP-binding protein
LAPVALARLASRLEPLDLAAGSTLLREGDPGDRAYLLAAGELVAEQDGREIGRLHQGAVVSEIALLRDAPRMATLRAVADCRLLTIERNEFSRRRRAMSAPEMKARGSSSVDWPRHPRGT